MESQKTLATCQNWPRPNRRSCKEISSRSAYYNVVCTEMIGGSTSSEFSDTHIDAHVKHAILSNVKQYGNNK